MEHLSTQPTLQFPSIDRDDIRQEAALLQWQGITPSLSIIRKRLEGQDRYLLASGFSDNAVTVEAVALKPPPPPEVVESLVDWALAQSDEVQSRFFSFLGNPEGELEDTLRFLEEKELLRSTSVPVVKAVPMAQIMLSSLPATKEELYDVIRTATDNERPESTVRQWLRRGLRNGLLHTDEQGYIRSTQASNDAPDR